jgi:aryl carrier-like protein
LPAGWTSIPYGWPLANQQYRVVDTLGRDCPDWVEGELWIGGAGVATGYRGAPDLTRERFVHADGGRWYRTGDMGRYRPGGLLEFLGRRDQQVKLRGHRIELGEVEAALASLPGVKQAVALLAGSPPGLAAFILTEAGIAPLDEETLRAGLARLLPDYMIPSRYLPLAALPLSANGKLDRNALKRLAEQAANADAGGDDTPLPGLEQAIAGIWQAVLGCARVGRQDDFFQLGGDSLRATQIMEQLARQHITRQAPPLRLLFTTPQLAAFAATLQAHDGPEADFETGEL